MVEVKIKVQVITHQYGTLSTGDILRTSEEFAAHLVNDCGAAEYIVKSEEVTEEIKKSKQGRLKRDSAT